MYPPTPILYGAYIQLIAQQLFKQRPNLLCPAEYLHYHRAVYSILLRRHLKAKHRNAVRAERKYCRLMTLMEQYNVNEDFRKLFAEVDITQLGHLVVELLNFV